MTVEIIVSDCTEALRKMDAESVDCVVTSPPYWGLRDYGVEGQLGLEPTLAEHLAAMVAVFEEVKRVLKPTGTCWVNYGDCYSTHAAGKVADPMAKSTLAGVKTQAVANESSRASGRYRKTVELAEKQLCMVPNRFAIAMQEAGWWVRSEIIWAKPNPMPESIKDRPATSHEKIWLFTKAARYFYDCDAVRLQAQRPDWQYETATTPGNKDRKDGGCTQRKTKSDKQRGHSRRHAGFNDRWDQMTKAEQSGNGRNLRNYEPAPSEVWPIATMPFSEAHFATFPPELAKRCIEAGCPSAGTVLDPFGGAGTTGLVADRLQRNAILIELNPEYAEIARKRIAADRPAMLELMEAS